MKIYIWHGVAFVRPSVRKTLSSPLKPPGQYWPNSVWKVRWWHRFEVMPGDSTWHPRWPPLLKIAKTNKWPKISYFIIKLAQIWNVKSISHIIQVFLRYFFVFQILDNCTNKMPLEPHILKIFRFNLNGLGSIE